MEIAKASVAEPGCFRYEVLRDLENPTVLHIFEVFQAKEAHSWHTQTEHFNAWWETSAHLLDGEMEIVSMNTLFPSVKGYKTQKPGLLNW